MGNHISDLCSEYNEEQIIKRLKNPNESFGDSRYILLCCDSLLSTLCNRKMKNAALVMLSIYGKQGKWIYNSRDELALMSACRHNMKNVALEILKYPKKCGMNKTNSRGETALILACMNNMKNVALEILKYPNNCGINKIDRFGRTALILACINNMNNVAREILKYTNIYTLLVTYKGYNEISFIVDENEIDLTISTIQHMYNSNKMLQSAIKNNLTNVIPKIKRELYHEILLHIKKTSGNMGIAVKESDMNEYIKEEPVIVPTATIVVSH